MKTRGFGPSQRRVSEIGLGCWQIGGGDWGSLDEELAIQILTTAVASGVSFFDTADVYGEGRSESLIGKFLKGGTEPIFVATKLGRGGGMYPNNYTESGARAATEASLARLGVGSLDLTQLHCVPVSVLREGKIFDWLRKFQQEGMIKQFGASVESMEEALVCLEQPGLASLQIIFNIFRQQPIKALFDAAAHKGVAIIARLPLASGLLAGKMTKATRFAAEDHRSYNKDGEKFNVGETFAGIPFDRGVELADALRPLVPAGMTMARMAQRWILDHDAVSVIITGASKPSQVVENAAVSELPPLADLLHAKLEEFYEGEVAPHIRGPV